MSCERTQAFFDFINERENIRLRKEAGVSPLTQDSILSEYKFTNVRRHHDWTSTKLRKEFYAEHFSDNPASILMNAALARYFGTFEFAEAVGWQDYDSFDFEEIKRLAKDRLEKGKRVFTGAYVITNQGMSLPKYEVVVDYFLRALHEEVPYLVAIVQKTRNWQQVAEAMMKIGGFGGTGFMTKEILLDTTFTNFWGEGVFDIDGSLFTYPADWYGWTPIGPGARRGAARVNGIDDVKSYEAKPYLGKSSHAAHTIFDLLLDSESLWAFDDKLCPTDIQFQLCEFDKYERVRLGQGRPRSKYNPR